MQRIIKAVNTAGGGVHAEKNKKKVKSYLVYGQRFPFLLRVFFFFSLIVFLTATLRTWHFLDGLAGVLCVCRRVCIVHICYATAFTAGG